MEWEYFVHSLDLGGMFSSNVINAKDVTQMLNWYGAQGWEFVSSFSSAGGNGLTMSLGFIFKRPKQAGAAAQGAMPMNS